VRAIQITTILAAALALAACGEKDEPAAVPAANVGQSGGSGDDTGGSDQTGPSSTGTSDEHEIATAAETVIGGNDPERTCERYATIVYVKHAYGSASGCRRAVTGQKSFAVDVSGIDVEGKTATAKAKPTGGPNQGETLKVDLIRQEGIWRVDLVRSNVKVGP
jgi:hypothetical protein